MSSFNIRQLLWGDMKRRDFEAYLDRSCDYRVSYSMVSISTLIPCLGLSRRTMPLSL